MERPQVRQVETQHVESEREVTGWEAEELLRKYGYTEEYTTREQPQQQTSNNLSFEEMIAQQEAKERNEEMRKKQKLNGPKPTRMCNYQLYDNCFFVPPTGFEPAHSGFKPDTTANYVTGAVFVPLPRFELGHYASKAHTTTNYVIEAFLVVLVGNDPTLFTMSR
jgi:hypothetical protein